MKSILLKLLKEELNNSKMQYWHGGDLETYSDFIEQKMGRFEFGPGLYLTKRYDIAVKYAKGSRKLYLITVDKGNDIKDVDISFDKAVGFINMYCLTKHKKNIIQSLTKYNDNGLVPAEIFNNLILNHKAIKGKGTMELRKFLVQNGIDYEVMDAYGFGEMLVLYNMQKIDTIKRITSRDKIEKFDL